MIVRISGTLAEVNEESIVLERDGLAREVLVPRYAIAELASHRGQVITLHTSEFFEGNQASGNLVPRMLGFLHTEDREFFTKFVNVKGIGPRKALKALSEPARKIATWIESGDVQSLKTLSGIGARSADLIVASLKGTLEHLAAGAVDVRAADASHLSIAQRDAIEVLVAWGDPRGDAQRWIERAAQLHPDTEAADKWVRAAYRVKTGAEG